jgi:hypothetical protein
MSLYVLDTDTLQLFQDEHPQVIARVRGLRRPTWLLPLSPWKNSCPAGTAS